MAVKHMKILPTDCPHEDDLALATEYWRSKERLDLVARIKDIALEFRAHHEALNSRFYSWPAAWRTWYIRAVRFEKKPKSMDAVRDFRTTGRRGRAPYVAPKPEENTVTHKMIHELTEKLRSPAQKRLWTK